jgi:DNA polymerase/3'-5' exonuclease PolX
VLFIRRLPFNSKRIAFLSGKLKTHGAQVCTDAWVEGVTHVCLECTLAVLFKWSTDNNCADAMPAPSRKGCPVDFVKPQFISDLLSAKRPLPPTWKHRWGQAEDLSLENSTMAEFMQAKANDGSSLSSSSSAIDDRPLVITAGDMAYINSEEIRKATCIKTSLTTALDCHDMMRVHTLLRLARSRKSWSCQVPEGAVDDDNNIIPDGTNNKHNEHLVKHFVEIADIYDTLGSQDEYAWKKRGFTNVVVRLRKCPYDIVTPDLAYKHLRPLTKEDPEMRGKSTSQKAMKWANRFRLTEKMYGYVIEILKSGRCTRLDGIDAQVKDRLDAWGELQQIHGVGPSAARTLFNKGFTTVAELRGAVELEAAARATPSAAGNDNHKLKPILNPTQMIGLRHHADLQVRIPRDEVREIAAFVEVHAQALHPGAVVECCGSYRRGKTSSGDCDVMITMPRDKYGHDVAFPLQTLLDRLRKVGFLVDDLSNSSDSEVEGGMKQTYMGVCRLPQRVFCRRIDIKTFPRSMWAFAKLYFTGSDWFNRSMRLWSKKLGWTLSDKGLSEAFRSRNEGKVFSGESLACESEREIFEKLGLEYVSPKLRSPDLFR